MSTCWRTDHRTSQLKWSSWKPCCDLVVWWMMHVTNCAHVRLWELFILRKCCVDSGSHDTLNLSPPSRLGAGVFLSHLAAKSAVSSEKAWYTFHFFSLGARARDLYQSWPSRVVTCPGLWWGIFFFFISLPYIFITTHAPLTPGLGLKKSFNNLNMLVGSF
jgi:hypothetical protein